jgi:hypothetical protein
MITRESKVIHTTSTSPSGVPPRPIGPVVMRVPRIPEVLSLASV